MHVQAGSSPGGAAWLDKLEGAISGLGAFPYQGKVIRSRPGLRRILHGKDRNIYLIVYKVDEAADRVIIVAIIHGRTREGMSYI